MEAEINEKKTGLCRVCLSTVKKKSMSLFQEYKNHLIFNHVNAIANVQIKKDDGLPDKICPACLLELETAINFKEKCESSNIILQTSTLNKSVRKHVGMDITEVKIKKEEPNDDGIEFLEEDAHFMEHSDLFDEEDEKPIMEVLNLVEQSLRKTRAINLQLQCDDCGEFFRSKCKLRVHWKNIHLKQALICKNCKRIFKTYKAFNRHQKDKRQNCIAASNFRIEGQGKSRTFYCKECVYKSLRMKDMITHWVIHTGDRPFKCDLCPKACTQRSSLEAHKESAHNAYKVETTCQFCGKLIKGRNRLYRHLKIHTDKGLQCQVCQKILKNKNSLSEHMRRHSGVKSYTCEKCANSFYTSAELSNHKRTVHNKGKYSYNCELCEYKATRKETIKKHQARHTKTNHPCKVCGMFFECENKLILHQRYHYEEKKYSCPHCDMKFFRRDTVGKHIRAKHRCTMVVNQKVGYTVKEENLVTVNKYDDIIEIEVSPVNGS